MTLAGLLLTQLRLKHNSLWLPYGFHLGWNLLQIAIFGPATGDPSLRPLHLHGPEAWVGQPGMPEPGWLATAAITIILAFLLLRRQQQAQKA
jgi:membrane protease YdiL (CAAX protease family)